MDGWMDCILSLSVTYLFYFFFCGESIFGFFMFFSVHLLNKSIFLMSIIDWWILMYYSNKFYLNWYLVWYGMVYFALGI